MGHAWESPCMPRSLSAWSRVRLRVRLRVGVRVGLGFGLGVGLGLGIGLGIGARLEQWNEPYL